MRAALIGNREDTDAGIIGHVLRERGFSFVEFAREDPGSYSDPAGFDLAALAQASAGFSGAEIEQAIVAALYAAHARGAPLGDPDA